MSNIGNLVAFGSTEAGAIGIGGCLEGEPKFLGNSY